MPNIISRQKLQKKQSVFGRKEDVLIVKFCDRRMVHVITTKYIAGYKEQTRHTKGGAREMLQKPLPIHHYSDQMGAVDTVDQLLEPHDPTRKSYAWFKKIGVHMMSRMVLNARVIYQNLHKCSIGCSEFIKLVVHEMLQEYSLGYASLCVVQKEQQLKKKPRRTGVPMLAAGAQPPPPTTRAQPSTAGAAATPVVHGLMTIPSTANTQRPRRRCRICTTEGKNKWTRKYCPACKDLPGLCSPEHYQIYHSQQ